MDNVPEILTRSWQNMDPDRALSDGPNMLKLKDVPALLSELVELDRIAKRRPA